MGTFRSDRASNSQLVQEILQNLAPEGTGWPGPPPPATTSPTHQSRAAGLLASLAPTALVPRPQPQALPRSPRRSCRCPPDLKQCAHSRRPPRPAQSRQRTWTGLARLHLSLHPKGLWLRNLLPVVVCPEMKHRSPPAPVLPGFYLCNREAQDITTLPMSSAW